MFRNIAVALALMLLSQSVLGLGLGTLRQSSSLNQPFDGRIEILGAIAGNFDTIVVKLADSEQFERADRIAPLPTQTLPLLTGTPSSVTCPVISKLRGITIRLFVSPAEVSLIVFWAMTSYRPRTILRSYHPPTSSPNRWVPPLVMTALRCKLCTACDS